ncbi:metallophosphoesterase [Rufibacter latericius]|uniref:Serine/threonine protein phosphatase n=1 Tax=Rufibacter latericius TaxID=2487040 RepID=A0A3M9MJJ2_9BACT|nr:metallophosphoesterase [Rufibacter latericius]RNI25033.1 serine/threonine protein phosphatase [Rufibacter latericius]
MSRYAISDIHGCAKTFKYMVEEVLHLRNRDSLFLLGDYIDRGPDSKGVLDYILKLIRNGYKVYALSGNHEYMMLRARENLAYNTFWLTNGGKETLESFRVETIESIKSVYWDLLEQLELYMVLDDYLLVHAGFNFAISNPERDKHTLLWAREFEVDKQKLGNRRIIHGHTPLPLEQIKYSLRKPVSNVLNIDAGCVFKSQLGYLVALNLDTLELHSVPSMDS